MSIRPELYSFEVVAYAGSTLGTTKKALGIRMFLFFIFCECSNMQATSPPTINRISKVENPHMRLTGVMGRITSVNSLNSRIAELVEIEQSLTSVENGIIATYADANEKLHDDIALASLRDPIGGRVGRNSSACATSEAFLERIARQRRRGRLLTLLKVIDEMLARIY